MKPSKKYNFSMARSNTYTIYLSIYLSRPLASLARFSLSKCSLMASPCNWRLGRGSYGRTALKPKTQAHRPKKGNEAPQIGLPTRSLPKPEFLSVPGACACCAPSGSGFAGPPAS